MPVFLVIIVPALLVLSIALLYPLKPPKGFESTPAELTESPSLENTSACRVIPFPAGHTRSTCPPSRSQAEGVLVTLSELRDASVR